MNKSKVRGAGCGVSGKAEPLLTSEDLAFLVFCIGHAAGRAGPEVDPHAAGYIRDNKAAVLAKLEAMRNAI